MERQRNCAYVKRFNALCTYPGRSTQVAREARTRSSGFSFAYVTQASVSLTLYLAILLTLVRQVVKYRSLFLRLVIFNTHNAHFLLRATALAASRVPVAKNRLVAVGTTRGAAKIVTGCARQSLASYTFTVLLRRLPLPCDLPRNFVRR